MDSTGISKDTLANLWIAADNTVIQGYGFINTIVIGKFYSRTFGESLIARNCRFIETPYPARAIQQL